VAPLDIDPGHLTGPADLPRVVAGVEMARALLTSPALTPHIGGVAPETRPLMSSRGPELRAAVVAQLNTYHHPVGTCRMGVTDDEMAVVDSIGSFTASPVCRWSRPRFSRLFLAQTRMSLR